MSTSTVENETVDQDTFCFCDAEDAIGKKFLRKVIRDQERCDHESRWKVYAGESTDYHIEFRRNIVGEVGEPGRTVEVRMRQKVENLVVPGMKAGYQSKDVMVMDPTGLHLDGNDMLVLCRLMMQKACRIAIEGGVGSQNSSEFGYAYYYLTVRTAELGKVTIGNHAVSFHGRRGISGTVNI